MPPGLIYYTLLGDFVTAHPYTLKSATQFPGLPRTRSRKAEHE